jgi:hypothetical protein
MRPAILRSILAFNAMGLLAVLAGPVRADSVIYQSGFESPTYSVGALNGQDGWNSKNDASVQTSTVFAGTQAASITAVGDTGVSLSNHSATYNSAGNADQQVDITGEFFLSTAGTGTAWDLAAVTGNGGFIGQLIFYDASGLVRLGLAGTLVGGFAVSRGTWNQFDLSLDYATQIQSAYINGSLVAAGPFATVNTTLTSYYFGINALQNTTGTDTLSLDNLSITAVPLPASAIMGMALIGGLAATQANRRRKSIS